MAKKSRTSGATALTTENIKNFKAALADLEAYAKTLNTNVNTLSSNSKKTVANTFYNNYESGKKYVGDLRKLAAAMKKTDGKKTLMSEIDLLIKDCKTYIKAQEKAATK